MASTRASSVEAGIVEGRRRIVLASTVLALAFALVGCRGHTGGMTPGRGLARAAGAIATVAAAGIASAATRERRERHGGSTWSDPGEALGPLPRGGNGLGDAPLRLVRMPSGEAALAPEQITCTRTDECVAVAGAGCHPIAVRVEVAGELARPECEAPTEDYVPRCVHDLCRLESLAPGQAEPRRGEPGQAEPAPPNDSDDPDEPDGVPPPPPGYGT